MKRNFIKFVDGRHDFVGKIWFS